MSGGSDPVITKKPEGAWTHEIIEKPRQCRRSGEVGDPV